MKINEIIEKIKSGKEFSEFINMDSYITITLKKRLVLDIADFVLKTDESTGLVTCDMLYKELITVLFTTLYLTDIEVPGLFIEEELEDGTKLNILDPNVALDTYDIFIRDGVYKYLEAMLINNDIVALVDNEIKNRIEINNSISAVLSRTLNQVVAMIPTEDKITNLINSLPSVLADLQSKPELMNTVKTVLADSGRGKKSKKKTGDA